MYTVKYGESFLHDPISNDTVLDEISLTAKQNTCSYCDFTMHRSHPVYGKLKERDSVNAIMVFDDDKLIFRGFVYENVIDFQGDCSVKCKGDLGYLEDSVVPPYSTLGHVYRTAAPSTIDGFFEWLIDIHNRQTTADRQFEIGLNEASRLTEYNQIASESDSYGSLYDILKSELLDIYGGYIRLRYVNDRRIIDYLYEYTDTNSQLLDLGINLTDYIQTSNTEKTATFCVATGAKYADTAYPYDDGYFLTSDAKPSADKTYYTRDDKGQYQAQNDLTNFKFGTKYYEFDELRSQADDPITLTLVNDGVYNDSFIKVGDRVYNVDAVAARGWIGTVYADSDIANADELLSAAIKHLHSEINPDFSLEIKAVDMHLLRSDNSPIQIGEYVRCRSIPHNLDGYYLCTEIKLDLNDPAQSTYTLGVAYDTLTAAQSKRMAQLNRSIHQNYDAAAALSEEAKQAAQDANSIARKVQENAETAIYDTVTEYALGDSSEVPPTDESAWDQVYPTPEEGKYIWVRTLNIYGNGTIIKSNPFVSNAGGGSGDGENATLLTVSSSRGLLFKTKDVSTVLSVTVYNGSLSLTNIAQLTEVYGDTAYLQWYEQSSDDEDWVEIEASDERLSSNGFMLTISSTSIAASSSYRCELIA